MKFTLYYQMPGGHTVVIATSNSLLKLCKIKEMTFHGRKGFPYIIETARAGHCDCFSYGAGSLYGDAYTELMRFSDNVAAGKYYASYDYSKRLLERDATNYNPFPGKEFHIC